MGKFRHFRYEKGMICYRYITTNLCRLQIISYLCKHEAYPVCHIGIPRVDGAGFLHR